MKGNHHCRAHWGRFKDHERTGDAEFQGEFNPGRRGQLCPERTIESSNQTELILREITALPALFHPRSAQGSCPHSRTAEWPRTPADSEARAPGGPQSASVTCSLVADGANRPMALRLVVVVKGEFDDSAYDFKLPDVTAAADSSRLQDMILDLRQVWAPAPGPGPPDFLPACRGCVVHGSGRGCRSAGGPVLTGVCTARGRRIICGSRSAWQTWSGPTASCGSAARPLRGGCWSSSGRCPSRPHWCSREARWLVRL